MTGENNRNKIVPLSGNQTVLKGSFRLMEDMDLTSQSQAEEGESMLGASEFFKRGLDKFNRGNYRSAIEDFNQALRINPNLIEAYYYRGMTRYKKADALGAIQDYNEVLRLNPDDADAYSNRGLVRAELGDRWGAMQDYSQALKLDSKHIKTYLNRSLMRIELEDYPGAISDCNAVLIINPKLPKAYLNRGLARYKLEDYQAALDDYNRALKLNPNLAEGFFNRGLNRIALQEYQSAIADFDQALQLNPNYTQAYLNRGYARMQLGDNWGSLEDFDQALRLDPVSAKAFFSQMTPTLSHELSALGDKSQQLTEGLIIKGNLRYEAGDYQGALGAYNQVLKLDPNHAEAYNRRSTVRSALGDYQGALEDLEMAKNLSLNQPQTLQPTPVFPAFMAELTAEDYYQRGVDKLDIGDFQGAIEEFDRVLQMKGNDATTLTCRGFAYRRLGENHRAIEDLQIAAKLFYEQGDIKSALGIEETLKKLQK
jgi:tetratricopeptide (TPR) repeat protein